MNPYIKTALVVAAFTASLVTEAATRTGSFTVSVTIVDEGCHTVTAGHGVNVSCGRGTAYAIHMNPIPTVVQPAKVVGEERKDGWVVATVSY